MMQRNFPASDSANWHVQSTRMTLWASIFFIIIIFIHRGTTVITYKQANKINTDTNTKSAVIEKSAIIKIKRICICICITNEKIQHALPETTEETQYMQTDVPGVVVYLNTD